MQVFNMNDLAPSIAVFVYHSHSQGCRTSCWILSFSFLIEIGVELHFKLDQLQYNCPLRMIEYHMRLGSHCLLWTNASSWQLTCATTGVRTLPKREKKFETAMPLARMEVGNFWKRVEFIWKRVWAAVTLHKLKCYQIEKSKLSKLSASFRVLSKILIKFRVWLWL